MKSFEDIIQQWPSDPSTDRTGLQVFADDMRVAYGTAQAMKFRNSVSPTYWPRLIEHAAKRGIEGVTYPLLCQIYPRRGLGRPEGNGANRQALAS